MISLNHISKSYVLKRQKFIALDDVSLDLPDTGLILVTGKSGSGKTTLLNIIGGMDSSSSGDLIVDGIKIEDFDSYRNDKISFIFQDYNLINTLSVKDNLALAFDLVKKKPTIENIKNVLEEVNLPDEEESIEAFLSKKPNELSGGQKQRLAIARSLIKDSSILIMDEPSGSLDEENAVEISNLSKKLSNNHLVIVSSHNKNLFSPLADKVIELKRGKIIKEENKEGKEKTIKQSYNEKKSFKGWISFWHALKLALISLKNKKIKLITSLLLTLIAVTGLGTVLSLQIADATSVLLRTQYANNDSTSLLVQEERYYMHNSIYPYHKKVNFTDYQVDKINSFHKGKVLFGGRGEEKLNILRNLGPAESTDLLMYFVGLDASNCFEVDSNALNHGFISPSDRLKDKSISRLPENFNEIALNEFQAQLILDYGLYNHPFDEEAENSNNPRELMKFTYFDEIIGRKYGDKIITGIYSTKDDDLNFWIEHRFSNSDYINNLRNGNTLGQYFFLAKGYLRNVYENDLEWENSKKSPYSIIAFNVSRDLRKDKEFVDSMRQSQSIYGVLENKYSAFVSIQLSFRGRVQLVIWGIVIVCLLLSFLISLNYFFTNAKILEPDFGILKAMGSSKLSILSIVFIQSGFVSLIELLLSLIMIAIACKIINSLIYIEFLGFTFGIAGIIFLILFLFAFLFSLLGTIKVIKQNPVKVLKE